MSGDPPFVEEKEAEAIAMVENGSMDPAEVEALVRGFGDVSHSTNRTAFMRHIAALRAHWSSCMDRKCLRPT